LEAGEEESGKLKTYRRKLLNTTGINRARTKEKETENSQTCFFF